MDAVGAFRGGALFRPQPQSIGDMDAADNQNVVVLLDFTDRCRRQESLSGCYLARFQRAAQGAGQSARGRGDEIVESGVARRMIFRIDAIVGGDRGVDAKEHRF